MKSNYYPFLLNANSLESAMHVSFIIWSQLTFPSFLPPTHRTSFRQSWFLLPVSSNRPLYLCTCNIYNSSECFIIVIYMFVSHLDHKAFKGRMRPLFFCHHKYTKYKRCFMKKWRNILISSCLSWYYHSNGNLIFLKAVLTFIILNVEHLFMLNQSLNHLSCDCLWFLSICILGYFPH